MALKLFRGREWLSKAGCADCVRFCRNPEVYKYIEVHSGNPEVHITLPEVHKFSTEVLRIPVASHPPLACLSLDVINRLIFFVKT